MKYQFPDVCRSLRLTSVQVCICLLDTHILSGNEPTSSLSVQEDDGQKLMWSKNMCLCVWRAACFSIIGL